MKKRKLLLQNLKQINTGEIVSALGLGLYFGVSALKLQIVADCIIILFSVVSVWTFFSVVDLRERDKQAVSYNLLWGSGALAILIAGCGILTIKARLFP